MALSEITMKNISKILGIILTIIIIIVISLLFFDILLLLVISVLIAMMFNPVVKFLESNGMGRTTAVFSVFILSALIIFLGLSFFIPKIIGQFNTLAQTFSQDNITAFLSDIEKTVKNTVPFIDTDGLSNKITEISSDLFFQSIDNVSKVVTSIVSVIAISVIVPFMTFFILKDNDRIVKGILNIMPNKHFEMVYLVLFKIRIQLSRFVRGWLLDAFVVGSLSAIGLSILGIDNSITIGFIAGVGHLIPYFGPIIGGLPAVVISVAQFGNLSMLPSIIIMFILVYTIDNGLIQPNVFSKSTDMHPLMIIVLILAGSQVLGVIGMLLAVPVATVVKTAAREIYLGYKRFQIIRV